MLNRLRTLIPAAARERVYIVSVCVVTVLVAWGLVDVAAAAQWSALVIAVVTLVFAILHSTSTIRTALYSLLLATQTVAQAYGILNEEQWSAVLGLAAAVFGLSVAAAKTPTAVDGALQAVAAYAPKVIVAGSSEIDEAVQREARRWPGLGRRG